MYDYDAVDHAPRPKIFARRINWSAKLACSRKLLALSSAFTNREIAAILFATTISQLQKYEQDLHGKIIRECFKCKLRRSTHVNRTKEQECARAESEKEEFSHTRSEYQPTCAESIVYGIYYASAKSDKAYSTARSRAWKTASFYSRVYALPVCALCARIGLCTCIYAHHDDRTD